jgi:hypothetical protein
MLHYDHAYVLHAVLFSAAGWALSVAMSRAFGFKRLGGWALVPLVDMANHALASNAEIRFGEDGVVRMMANKQVRGSRQHVCGIPASHGMYDGKHTGEGYTRTCVRDTCFAWYA